MFVRGQTAMAKPDSRSARRAWVERMRPITEGRTVLPVIGHRTDTDGTRWLRVRLPGPPEQRHRLDPEGADDAVRDDLAPRRRPLRAAGDRYRQGRVVRTFSAVIGAASTPTPRGKYFVEETVLLEGARSAGPTRSP